MQRLLITTEAHVRMDARGHVYCDGPANYRFWSKYATVFDEVTVLARASLCNAAESPDLRADGPNISFRLIPDFYGPFELLQKRSRVQQIISQSIESASSCLLRAPGLVSHIAWQILTDSERPYALEVLGDPWDSFGPGSWPSVLRPLARNLMTRELKNMCEHASAVHYVTHTYLQRRFPPGQFAHIASYSDAMVEFAFATAEVLAQRYRRISAIAHDPGKNGPFRIGFIGSLSRLYKGLDVLLHAIANISHGCEIELQLLVAGSGFYLEHMKTLAKTLNVEHRTLFLGEIPSGKPVFSLLDSIDLLVLPSRAEGLPRIIIEAMARACPCIGTDVGGMSELLSQEDLVPCGSPEALGARMIELVRQPELLRSMVTRNLQGSERFAPYVLARAQQGFLERIKQHTCG